MGLEMIEANTCFHGCCGSELIPLHLPSSSYALLALIVRGAESTVYEVTLDGKRVAVKKPILSTSQDIDKFHKELQLLCKLDHPGVSRLVAANGKPPNYMSFFQFYESDSLADKIYVEEWCPSIDRVLVMTLQIANALKYLHDLGIVHRDVKPANILFDRNLNSHLADFGLAEYKREIKQVSIENWKSSGKPTGGFHKKNMYSRHFLYSHPAQPMGPDDLAWRMIAGKVVNIKLHTRRSQRMVKESRSLCTCDCKRANITSSGPSA